MDSVISRINKSSETSHDSTCNSLESSDHPFFMMVYSLLFLVALTINSFTLWFHCSGNPIQVAKSWMIYLKHLTAADFLLCASLPVRIVHYSRNSTTIHMLYCSIGAPLLFLNMSASILFMGYIAANRYMKIFYTSGTHFLMTTKASHIISITTWLVLLIIETPYCILMLINYKLTQNHSTCDNLLTDPQKPMFGVIHAMSFTIFLLVLFSLVFFYCSASSRVRQIQQRHFGSSTSKKLAKSRRKMLVLVSVFCFCFVPYHVVRLPYIVLREHCSEAFYYLKEVTVLVSVSNICLDPLIYVFLCKGFRAQLNQMLCTKGHKNTSTLEERHGGDQLNTAKNSSVSNGGKSDN